MSLFHRAVPYGLFYRQIESIEALTRLIAGAEGAMASSRKNYEAAIAARNNTGVMLIDRNDELAVLHEKAHLQEAQIAAGTLELGLRENEVRLCFCCCWCCHCKITSDSHGRIIRF